MVTLHESQTSSNATDMIIRAGTPVAGLMSSAPASLSTTASIIDVLQELYNEGNVAAAPTTQTGATYTIDSDDNNTIVRFTNASQVTVTIPTDASDDLADGYQVTLYAEGAGGVTLSTSGITLTGSSPNTTVLQNEALLLVKTATADTWMVIGGTAA